MNQIKPIPYVKLLKLPYDVQEKIWKLNRKVAFVNRVNVLNKILKLKTMISSNGRFYYIACKSSTKFVFFGFIYNQNTNERKFYMCNPWKTRRFVGDLDVIY